MSDAGGLLSCLLREPVYLSSLIVDKYFSAPHLERAVCSRINFHPQPAPPPPPFLSLPARLDQSEPKQPNVRVAGEEDAGRAVEARAPRILCVHANDDGGASMPPGGARRPVKSSRYAVLWLALPPAEQLLQVLETRTGRLVPANPAEQRVGGCSIACRRSLFRLFWLLGRNLSPIYCMSAIVLQMRAYTVTYFV